MSALHAPLLARLRAAADDPVSYAKNWKETRQRPVIGSFPMNFPSELVHAAGALPVIVQESKTPITEGRSMLAEFYCGYTRSVADQAAVGELDIFDGFVLADHCVQLLGAVDAIRYVSPEKPVHFAQFTSSMDDPWSKPRVDTRISDLKTEIETVVGAPLLIENLVDSIKIFNRNRQLLRRFYDLRRSGRARISASEMQVLVKSSMVMDVSEHTDVLESLLEVLVVQDEESNNVVRLHLSGHFCHAPKPEILDIIEQSGGLVVDDDLYTGFRYISTDVPETGDPLIALSSWYMERNINAPCPTRVTNKVDWDTYLLNSLEESRSIGVVVLMAKFCEPHMLYYPELRKALDAHNVPLLLLETEHEGLPVETMRTKLETFVERIRRQPSPLPA